MQLLEIPHVKERLECYIYLCLILAYHKNHPKCFGYSLQMLHLDPLIFLMKVLKNWK